MAGTIMHLVIADKLLDKLAINNPALFYCGNLAPDAIMARKQYEREMKRHTHFKDKIHLHEFRKAENQRIYQERFVDFYNRFVRLETPNRELYLGYVVHMLVDELYILEFRDRFVDCLVQEGKEPTDEAFFKKYVEDVDQVDWELVRSYQFHCKMPEILYSENEYEIDGWITKEELLDSREFIIRKNFETKHEKKTLQVMSLQENLDFIELCVNRIPSLLIERFARKRQLVHFTPKNGWTNDPNGLIYVNDEYHLFYQHYPADTKWGPMHWGHAKSQDLLHWEHLPIALYPTEEEYIFSGSAIVDEENVSGFGKEDCKAVLLFYTVHNPKTGEQMTHVAYSTDMLHFTKYEKNPIIANRQTDKNFKRDFRDPKVFRNKVKGGFGMVLAAGEAIVFFHSKDLLHWEMTGSFSPGEFGFGGICECPDFFAMSIEKKSLQDTLQKTDTEKYILTMSIICTKEGEKEESHVMQYFVGDFDGDCFINIQPFEKTQLLDFGPDNYAMVSFSNTPDVIMMGWGENWNAARRNTESHFFGKMSLPRVFKLRQVNGKYKLTQSPIFSLGENTKDLWEKKIVLKEGEEYSLQEETALKITNNEKNLAVNDILIEKSFAGNIELHMIYDCGYLEIFAEEGLIAYSIHL